MKTFFKIVLSLVAVCFCAFMFYIVFSPPVQDGPSSDQVKQDIGKAAKTTKEYVTKKTEKLKEDIEETAESLEKTVKTANQKTKQFFAKVLGQLPPYENKELYIQEVETSVADMRRSLDTLLEEAGEDVEKAKEDIARLEEMLGRECKQKMESLHNASQENWRDGVMDLREFLEKLDKMHKRIVARLKTPT